MNLKMNMITTRHSQGNETSRHVKTCHMRHIFMPGDQTIKKIHSCNNLLNATFQSQTIKMCCYNTINKCLSVTTINPLWCSHPVHHGTKHLTICSLTSKENILFAHNFILKQNTNQASHCFDFQSSTPIFSLSLGLDNLFFLQSILTLIVQTIVSAV